MHLLAPAKSTSAIIESDSPVVVAFGLGTSDLTMLGSEVNLVEAEWEGDILRCFAAGPKVLLIGPEMAPVEAQKLLQSAYRAMADRMPLSIVLGQGDVSKYQFFTAYDRLFYAAPLSIDAPQLLSIVKAAVAAARSDKHSKQIGLAERVAAFDPAVELVDRLRNQDDLVTAGRLFALIVEDCIDGSRARFLRYDPKLDTLAYSGPPGAPESQDSAAAGVIGYIARTRERVAIPCLQADPKYDPGSDEPQCSLNSRFLGCPISLCTGELIGILTLSRDATRQPFSAGDIACVELLKEAASPSLSELYLQQGVQTALVDISHKNVPIDAFRREALEHHSRSSEQNGPLLQRLPTWLTTAHQLILLGFFAAAAFLAEIKVPDVIERPAVLKLANGRAKLSSEPRPSSTKGISIDNQLDQGDTLLTLRLAVGINSSGTPAITGGEPAEKAQTPDHGNSPDGVKGKEEGRGVDSFSVFSTVSTASVRKILPGTIIHLSLDQYPGYSQVLTVQRIGPDDGVDGSSNGEPAKGDARQQIIAIVSVAHAGSFQPQLTNYSYHDGMVGHVEIQIGSTPILFTLFPKLKKFVRL